MKSASHLLKSWADRVWDRLWREMNVGEGFTKATPSVGQIIRVEGILFSWRCEEGWNAARKRGRNCNNSCRLLRNTECFPAIWINKHSLDPWGPDSASLQVDALVSAISSTVQPNMLPINGDERGNNCKFKIPGFGNSRFGPKLVVLYLLSCHLGVCEDTNQPGQILPALLIRTPRGDYHPAPVSHRERWRHPDLPGSSLPLHLAPVAGLLQPDRHLQRVPAPARRTFHFSFSPLA